MLNKAKQEEKTNLHSRNLHRNRYDFPQLINKNPDLKEFVFVNNYKDETIDFKNPKAVKALNKAILKYHYKIDFWDIPEGFLCPPIPGRSDYIHYLADLLASCNDGIIPRSKLIKVLDIGVGANCIYPLIGYKEYNWHFVGSEINSLAIRAAKNIIDANSLSKVIEIRKQNSDNYIFEGIVRLGEKFDLTMCNPPFHNSATDALHGTKRKLKNLGQNEKEPVLNFGGQNYELWCNGGEQAFISRIIKESLKHSKSIFWFTSLVSKKDSLPEAYKALENIKAFDVRTIEMAQGQKVSRILAWTFLTKIEQEQWQAMRWKK